MAQDAAITSYDFRSVAPVAGGVRSYALPVRLQPATSFAKGQVIGAVTTTTANDKQTFTATGTPTGGSFGFTVTNPLTLTTSTLTVPFNATAAVLKPLADAIYGAGNTVAAGGPWPGTALTLSGAGLLAGVPIAIATAGTNAFTGGSTPTATIAHTTTGVTAGLYGVYASGNSDGTQTAEAILPRAVQTDAAGLITESSTAATYRGEFGQTRTVIEAWFGGVFVVADLTGLDSTAVTAMGGKKQKAGTLLSF